MFYGGETSAPLPGKGPGSGLFCSLRGVSRIGAFKVLSSSNPRVLTSGVRVPLFSSWGLALAQQA